MGLGFSGLDQSEASIEVELESSAKDQLQLHFNPSFDLCSSHYREKSFEIQ